MKFIKFLLLAVICLFLSPITPTYAVINAHSVSSSVVLEKKTTFKLSQAKRIGLFGPTSKTEAIVMGIISLIGTVFAAIYVPILLSKGISGIILGVVLGMLGVACLISVIIYGIVLLRQRYN